MIFNSLLPLQCDIHMPLALIMQINKSSIGASQKRKIIVDKLLFWLEPWQNWWRRKLKIIRMGEEYRARKFCIIPLVNRTSDQNFSLVPLYDPDIIKAKCIDFWIMEQIFHLSTGQVNYESHLSPWGFHLSQTIGS